MKHEFRSDLAGHISEFIGVMEIQRRGNKGVIKKHLAQFDELCIELHHATGFLDREIAEEFCRQDESLPRQENRQKVSSLRQFAYHLIGNGNAAYIPPFPVLPKAPQEPVFLSCLSSWMESLLKEKQAMGMEYRSGKYLLLQFDGYLAGKGFVGNALTKEMVEGYSKRPDSESGKTAMEKLGVVRMLAIHILRNGGNAHVPENPAQSTWYERVPSVFSKEEIQAFFAVADTTKRRFPWGEYIVPVYFRLLYLTGMRKSECCGILRSDIDYENKRILIRNAKGNKDRYVYFSDYAKDMLQKYDKRIDRYSPCRKHLFVGLRNCRLPLSAGSIAVAFDEVRLCSGIPRSLTVHSFRHTYVIDKILEWEQSGKDVNAMIPYLSKQLGHKSIAETYGYCKRLDSRFPGIIKLTVSSGLIPEVER